MRLAPLAVLLAAGLLASCRAVPEVAGVIGGALAGSATANPAVGFAVAVGVDAATNAGIKYVGRTRQGAEQDAIAAQAGELEPGGHATWRIRHTIPYGNEHGELTVLRRIETPIAACKEIAFSVDGGDARTPHQAWYDADICRQGAQWKWASAEPAVARWGVLQ